MTVYLLTGSRIFPRLTSLGGWSVKILCPKSDIRQLGRCCSSQRTLGLFARAASECQLGFLLTAFNLLGELQPLFGELEPRRLVGWIAGVLSLLAAFLGCAAIPFGLRQIAANCTKTRARR